MYSVYDPLMTACATTPCNSISSAHHASAGYATPHHASTRTTAVAVTCAIIIIGTGCIFISIIIHATAATCTSIGAVCYVSGLRTSVTRIGRYRRTYHSNYK